MSSRWSRTLRQVLSIAGKDIRIYFFKGPNLTFGLFLPLVLYWAFALEREIALEVIIPGLVAIAIFFGAGAIQAVSLPLERRTGTMHTLLAAPVKPLVIVLGKALAGLVFGLILASAYTVVMLLFLPLRPNLFLFSVAALTSSFCFSAFGLCLAAPFRDIPQAMPPATVVRIVMVFLSGAFAPLEGVSPTWAAVARLLPLTYAVDALRQAVNGLAEAQAFVLNLGVLSLYTFLFLGITAWLLRKGDV
jgi:ABC-2 type transport system permease protein